MLTSLALVISLQGVGDTYIAIENEDPETWVVEYPRLIQPFVVEYRSCLNIANRKVTGAADFQMQHRADVPRCAEAAQKAKAGANAAMEGARTQISREQVDT